jgi:hypothetical protein
MDSTRKAFYGLHFTNRYRALKGAAFQSFFESIMLRAFSDDFIAVAPYGNQGDMKCDGYQQRSQQVFQCYSPHELKDRLLRKKIDEDLAGALNHWGNKMRSWVFVHNGVGSALPAPAAAHIADLIQKHPDIQLEVWSEERVKDQLSLLRLDQLEDLFGAVPCSHDLDQIQLDELRPVVLALKKLEADANVPLMAPSVHKLQANALSNEAADLLKMGRRKEQLVQRFFDTYIDPTLGEDIAQAFRARYQALKDAKKSADEMFSELQIFSGGMTTGTPAHQGAVLAVMSYFFERCDIFEDALSAQTP